MKIHVHEKTRTFHLQNDKISYIMTVLEGGYPGQLYFGNGSTTGKNIHGWWRGLCAPMRP